MITEQTLENVLRDITTTSLRRSTKLQYLVELIALELGIDQKRFKELWKYADELHDMDLMELRLKEAMEQNND